LQHAPKQTGLPVWVYTQYAHLSEMPRQQNGQRVRMGEVIGSTSNTGQGAEGIGRRATGRRPALHLGAFYSPVPRFVRRRLVIFPVRGNWMDPHALLRGRMPIDSRS